MNRCLTITKSDLQDLKPISPPSQSDVNLLDQSQQFPLETYALTQVIDFCPSNHALTSKKNASYHSAFLDYFLGCQKQRYRHSYQCNNLYLYLPK